MMSGEQPTKSKFILKLLDAWEPSDEILPDVDQGLLPPGDVELPTTEFKQQAVLTKAVVRAAGLLGLPDDILATILGMSPETVERLKRGDYLLLKSLPEWELGVLVIRIFRALDIITGSVAQEWLSNQNEDFDKRRPMDVMQTPEGLRDVCGYLEAHLNQA